MSILFSQKEAGGIIAFLPKLVHIKQIIVIQALRKERATMRLFGPNVQRLLKKGDWSTLMEIARGNPYNKDLRIATIIALAQIGHPQTFDLLIRNIWGLPG